MTETPVKPATPRQLVFECKSKDGVATLELMTHGGTKDGVHRWTQLSAAVLVKPVKPKKGLAPQRPVRLAWAIADLSDCRLTLWRFDDSLWIGSASFDVDRAEVPRLTEFLVSLGVEIEDNTKL